MIACTLSADKTPYGSRGIAWIASAEVGGQRHEARHTGSAACALARALVDAGVPDQPMEVRQVGIAGVMTWPSMHRAAKLSVSEGNTLLHSVTYTPMMEGHSLPTYLAENNEGR